MLKTISSPELLQLLWNDFEERYIKQLKHKPSKRLMCEQLDLDEHALSKWMNKDGHKNRRIPVEHIERVAVAMMLAPEHKASLMKVRLREIAEDDPSMKVLLKWVSDTVKESVTRRYALAQDEALVLKEFRKARENFPRGLYLDSDETETLQSVFSSLLKVAEENHIAEARSEEVQDTPEAREQIKKAMDKMSQISESLRRTRPKSFVAALQSAKLMSKK